MSLPLSQYHQLRSETLNYSLVQPYHSLQFHSDSLNTFNSSSKNKLQYVLNLIQKYQLNSNPLNQISTKTSPQPQDQTLLQPESTNQLSYFALTPQNTSFYRSENLTIKNQDSFIAQLNHQKSFISELKHGISLIPKIKDEKDEDCLISQVESQLQQTHQKILNKYLTPMRDTQPSCDSANSNQLDSQKIICEFLNSSDRKQEHSSNLNVQNKNHNKKGQFQKQKQQQSNQKQQESNYKDLQSNQREKSSQLVDEISVPLVESLIMLDNKSQFNLNMKEYFNFKIIQQVNLTSQNSQPSSNQPPCIDEKYQKKNKNQQSDEFKLSHIFAFCLISLALLLWKM